ncbi:MAG TPA: FimV/HubP family polar landmark protein, partial [Burkholderiaceae bacterium]|nr:FimV/HubP family polar landmark protein [Burkholderiaceae bacterium]
LDPPSLRQQAEVMAPAAPPAPVAAPAPARPAPAASAPATAAAPAASPAPTPRPATTAAPEGSYTVKSGDTLGRIAAQNKPAGVSLDQMLVAMFRQNPEAFAGSNMNRLKAGAKLNIPSAADATGIAAGEARQEVVAQSADFAQYKSRLAQAAAGSPAIATTPPTAAAGGGQVTTRVEDKGAPAQAGGDQLKIAKADDKGAPAAAAAAAKADEAAAKARAVKEEQERAEQLRRTNEALKKALEIQSKPGAQVQQQAEQKAAPAAAPAPEAPKSEPAKAEAAKSEAPPPAPVPASKAAPPATPIQEESNTFVDMLGNRTTQLGLVGIVALLAGLFGWSAYRKRRAESSERFKETNEGLQANSLFGATGGQSVDTGTSTFNSSFIPAASQLDSNEVDPVAEADVYIAYGREEQAEDILKEALRLQPDRNAVRLKLLEIYARRGDKAAFMTIAEDLKERTSATGEDWEKALRLGRTMDPDHPMFAGAPMTELARGPATAFRLDPDTAMGRPSTLTGAPTAGLDLSGLTANSISTDTASSAPPLTRMVVDTRMTDTEMRNVDTKMPDTIPVPASAATTAPAVTAAHAPTTQFRATLSGAENKNTISAATAQSTDFGSLDFDLGPTKMNFGPTTQMPDTKMGWKAEDPFAPTAPKQPAAAPAVKAAPEAGQPAMTTATTTAIGQIPDLDLNIPPSRTPAPAPAPLAQPAVVVKPAVEEEALSRPTVIGLMKAPGVNTMMLSGLPEDAAARLTSNTEQATVPLIDFDLSAISIDAATKRGETEPGSALAQQMATKLDLARGYIDLGVKDGARELLDEVMRDGTRDQRTAAVDLIKQIEN